MKRLTRHGYLINKSILPNEKLNEIRKELTLTPDGQDYLGTGNLKSFIAYDEDDEWLVVPRFYGIKKFGQPDINRLERCAPIQIEYLGELYENQKVHVSKCLHGLTTVGGGLLIAGCGLGKTNMALYIACQLGVKTLFIVHTNELAKQIRERAYSFTTVKKVGLIQGPNCEYENDIVIGTVQTITGDKYHSDIYRDFGLVIIDEVHHMGAEVFSKAYSKTGSKYILGISAENSRKDGMYKLIHWNMGEILTFQAQPPNEMVIVKRYEYTTSNKHRLRFIPISKRSDKANISRMESNLMHIKKRNRFLVNVMDLLYEMDRNILSLSSRTIHAYLFNKLVKGDSTMFISETPEEIKREASSKRLISSVYQMFKEAIDMPNLNTLVMCMPVSDPKQPIGRILRKKDYTVNPIVIDIVDMDSAFVNRSRARCRYYKKQKYKVQTFKVTDIPGGEGIQWDDIEAIKATLLFDGDTDTPCFEKLEEEWVFE